MSKENNPNKSEFGISKEEVSIICPNCNNQAAKTIWRVGKLTLWMINCISCGHRQDEHSLLSEGKQN